MDLVTRENFSEIAMEVFCYQYERQPIYRQYADLLGKHPKNVHRIEEIPFLPLSFFRTHLIINQKYNAPSFYFESSGTSDDVRSRHYIGDLTLYHKAIESGFNYAYGRPEDYGILALLPSYLERKNASLVYMCQYLMDRSGDPDNGFYLDDFQALSHVIRKRANSRRKTLLIGVTFALLDFAASSPGNMEQAIVMETGGMKGRRKEWTRGEVHRYLMDRLGVDQVHSEYGMTEMLSQAYAKKDGKLILSPSMAVLVREINDPLAVSRTGTGALNIIDLANLHSCSFIATDDQGTVNEEYFEVLGRIDHSALRGCSLLTA